MHASCYPLHTVGEKNVGTTLFTLMIFKSPTGLLLLFFPVYLYTVILLTIVLRNGWAVSERMSSWCSIFIAMASIHCAPLIVFFSMLLNGYWFSNYGFDISVAWMLLFAHGIAGTTVIALEMGMLMLPFHVFFLVSLRYKLLPLPDRVSARKLLALTYCVLTLVSTSYIYEAIRAMTQVDIEERTITVVTGGSREFVVAITADTQADAFTGERRLMEYMSFVRGVRPDLILFAGDIATGTLDMEFPRIGIACLSSVRASKGTFVVMGDHDFWSSWRRIDSVYRIHEVPRLLNELVSIHADDLDINLIGITNVMNDPADARRLDTLLSKRVPHAFSILLTHQLSNEIAEQAARAGVQVVAAGHTHGGQIGIKPMHSVLSWFGMSSRYLSGWYTLHHTNMFVCNGVGLSVLPLRIFAVPSIGVLRIRY